MVIHRAGTTCFKSCEGCMGHDVQWRCRKKRRSERNAREQERSHKITERITELRKVLAEAGVHFKPDRYSTLVSVVSYIKTLQTRSESLDEEHRRLLDTISGADRLVNGDGAAGDGWCDSNGNG